MSNEAKRHELEKRANDLMVPVLSVIQEAKDAGFHLEIRAGLGVDGGPQATAHAGKR